jgi:hypothetical protein
VRVSSSSGLEPESQSDGLQRAREQHGNEKRCRTATSSLSQTGLVLARTGISLKHARTWDGPVRGVACANESAKQSAGVVKIEGGVLRFFKQAWSRSNECMAG